MLDKHSTRDTAIQSITSLLHSWVEQDPLEILRLSHACIEGAVGQLAAKGFSRDDVKGEGEFSKLLCH